MADSVETPSTQIEIIPQKSEPVSNWNNLYGHLQSSWIDVLTILLVFVPGVIFILVDWVMGVSAQNKPVLIIGLYSLALSLLVVGQSARTREDTVAPTLFLAEKDEGQIGIVNIGEGAAHSVTVSISVLQPSDSHYSDIEPVGEGESLLKTNVVPVGDFVSFVTPSSEVSTEEVEEVKFEFDYKNNFGNSRGPVRRVTGEPSAIGYLQSNTFD